MTDNAAKRPPALTGACIYIGALAAIISIRAMTVVTSWNGDNRAKELDTVLSALRDAGLGRADAESSYRIFLTVVAVLAACAAVFAGYTSRGHAASRIGLTVTIGFTGAVAFLGFLGGGFLFSMIGALAIVFTVRLWTGENRTYFRTLAGHAPPPPKAVPAAAPTPAPAQQSAQYPPAQYPPNQYPPSQYPPGPEQPGNGYAPPPPGYYAPQQKSGALPRPVGIVVWTTLIGSALVAGVSALSLLALGVMGDDYERIMRESPLSDRLLDGSGMTYDQMYRTSMTILGLTCVVSLGGLAASILALVKKRSGGVFLFVMAVVTAIVSGLFFPIGLPWTAAAIVCIVQLRRPESKAWFSQE